MTEIRLPKLNVNEDSATMVAWAVPDGRPVLPGQVVCTVETNKAAVDVEAEAEGYLRHRARPGQECAVREVLGFITATPDELLPQLEWLPLPERPPAPRENVPGARPASRVRATLKARRLADRLGVDLAAVKSHGVIREDDVNKFAETAGAAAARPSAGSPASEPARRFAATILGTGSCLPERVVTNKDLIAIAGINTSDEWIRTKVGVVERRFAAPGEATSDLAARAAARALECAGLTPDKIGLIVLATTVPDRLFPATACLVQQMLGAPNAMAFDVNVMCTGTVYALDVARRYVEDGSVEYALVIGSEVYSRILDFSDRTSCIYFGDGAGAMVLGRSPGGRPGIITSYVQTDGSGYDTITAPAGGTQTPASLETVKAGLHYLRLDPKAVWEFATAALPRAVNTVLERAGLTADAVDLVISHQANINIIRAGMEALGLPMSKTFTTIEKYGNTSAASVAITLDEAFRLGKVRPGDLVVLAGFGGGLAWGAAAIRWTAQAPA